MGFDFLQFLKCLRNLEPSGSGYSTGERGLGARSASTMTCALRALLLLRALPPPSSLPQRGSQAMCRDTLRHNFTTGHRDMIHIDNTEMMSDDAMDKEIRTWLVPIPIQRVFLRIHPSSPVCRSLFCVAQTVSMPQFLEPGIDSIP